MILGIGHILLSWSQADATTFLSHFPFPPNLWTSDFLGQYMKKGGLLSGLPGPEIRLVKAKHTIPFLSTVTGLRVGMWPMRHEAVYVGAPEEKYFPW